MCNYYLSIILRTKSKRKFAFLYNTLLFAFALQFYSHLADGNDILTVWSWSKVALLIHYSNDDTISSLREMSI